MTAVVDAPDAVLAAIPLRLIERNPQNPRRDETASPEMIRWLPAQQEEASTV